MSHWYRALARMLADTRRHLDRSASQLARDLPDDSPIAIRLASASEHLLAAVVDLNALAEEVDRA